MEVSDFMIWDASDICQCDVDGDEDGLPLVQDLFKPELIETTSKLQIKWKHTDAR